MKVPIEEQRKFNWAALGVSVVIAVNLFALIWGAATISTGLKSAESAILELKEVGKGLTGSLNSLNNRVGILEVRVDGLKDEVRKQGGK